jgi:hypothetical protein
MLAATAAGAETSLTEFNGRWDGSGTDRDALFDTAQPTRCRVIVTADPTHMASDTECNGQAGLHKEIRLSVAFSGHRFTGSVEQTSSLRGSNAAPKRRAGSVTGRRDGDTADFVVRFGGLTPNARVILKLTSATSFSMLVSTLGVTLTDVKYHRPATR